MSGVGSRQQVWNGTAARTSGGLTKDDLVKNSRHTIVSKKKSEAFKTHPRFAAFRAMQVVSMKDRSAADLRASAAILRAAAKRQEE